MCDDLTEHDNQRWLAEKRLGRREFSAAVGATAAVLVAGCGDDDSTDAAEGSAGSSGSAGHAAGSGGHAAGSSGTDEQENTTATKSELVTIDTPDGKADAFFVYPESGRHPAVIVWPDVLGVRDAFKTMGTRLAKDGYAVLVVNQYYRTSTAPVLESWNEWNTDAGKAKLRPMIAAITPAGTTSDAAAFVEWLDKQDAVDTGKKIGTSGYCMGGPFTFRTAASKPERVGAFASLHGGGLVADNDDSPHLLFAKIKASSLIAIAMNDDERQPDAKTTLMSAAKDANLEAEIEVYPAMHGWCAIDSAVYDKDQADKAYDRMVTIFGKAL